MPDGLEVHLILDNLQTHKTPKVHRWLLRPPPVQAALHPDFVVVAEHGRTQAEPTNKKLRRSSHTSPSELAADITAWTDNWNTDPKPYRWVKAADQIFKSIALTVDALKTQDTSR